MKRNWFRIISPCVLTTVLCLVIIIISIIQAKGSEGWSLLAVYMIMPFLIFVIILDVTLKFLFKLKAAYIWLVETIVILLIMIFFHKILGLIF